MGDRWENGQRVVDYKGSRNAKDLERFVRKMLKPSVETLGSDAEFTKFIKDHDVAFVMVPGNDTTGKSSALEAAYVNASEHYQADVHFGRANTIPQTLQSADLPGVAVFSDGELRETLPISKLTEPESMSQFVEDNYIPLVPELGMGSFYRITHSGRLTVVGVVDPYADSRTKDVKLELREMAKKTKKYRFGWLDGVKWPEFLTQIGISQSDFPILLLINAPDKIHYVHRNTTYGRAQFITEVEAGNVPMEGEGASWISWITPGPTGAALIVGGVLVILTIMFSV